MTPIERMLSGLLVVGAMLGAGLVSLTWSDEPVVREINDLAIFSRFSSKQELSGFFELTRGDSHYDYGGLIPRSMEPTLDFQESESGYSRTNVQVEGIDELDIVKTDGENIYLATDTSVDIIKAYPPEQLSNLTSLSKEDVVPDAPDEAYVTFNGIFVSGDLLAVVTSWHEPTYWYSYDLLDLMPTEPKPPWSTVSVFDISNAASPALQYTAGVTGWVSAARLVGDNVYLIAHDTAYYLSGGVALPESSEDGTTSEIPLRTIRYDPDMVDPESFTNILAVDIVNQEKSVISIVTGYSSTIYVSPEAIYLTDEQYPEIVMTWDVRVMSAEDSVITRIYRISYDNLSMGATAKGEVKGTLLNQFSMDEYGEYLRVATTSGWVVNQTNSVYVLDSELKVIGSLEGIAPNEQIYSSRFIGDTLYLVTFRQVDPLFVIDLSIPMRPKVAGELTVPGFSTYLHPLDEDHIIGIGSENGLAKVTMFDVSDPASPIAESSWVLNGYHWSSTVWDHKQVLCDVGRSLLVLPVTAYDYSYDYSTSYVLNAALVFNVSAGQGVEFRGMVELNTSGYYYWGMWRSLYIGDYLYTVWNSAVKVSLLSDLSEVAYLEYAVPSMPYYRVMS